MSCPPGGRTRVESGSRKTDEDGVALVPTDGWTTTVNPQHDEERDPECSRACRKCVGQVQNARLHSWAVCNNQISPEQGEDYLRAQDCMDRGTNYAKLDSALDGEENTGVSFFRKAFGL
jgi:hypothetical protein